MPTQVATCTDHRRRRGTSAAATLTLALVAACSNGDRVSAPDVQGSGDGTDGPDRTVSSPELGSAPEGTDRSTPEATEGSTEDANPTTTARTTTTSSTTSTTSTTPTTTTSPVETSTTPASSTTLAVPAESPCPPTGQQIWENRPASDIEPPALPDGWEAKSIGSTIGGRPIDALVRRSATPRRSVVVVGGIHGNEPASPPSVRAMVTASIPDDVDVVLVPALNADGIAAGTRCNRAGVDLNRNFPWAWRADTGGPGPLSEPEPVAITEFVATEDPDLVVWVHQPLDYVSSIGETPDAYEQAWANASGLPVRPDVTQHGGGESWTALDAGIPSMLIEIDGWDATPDIASAQVAGFEAVLAVLEPR